MASAVDIKLRIENQQLAKDLANTKRQFARLRGQIEKDANGMAGALKRGFAALAIGAAVGQGIRTVVNGLRDAVTAADEMGKAAQSIGVATAELSKLEYAAGQSGVAFENLKKALAKVAVDLTKSKGLLRDLGVTATTADGALLQLSNVFQRMPDGLNKTSLAAKVFGERIGPELIPLLNQGEAGINKLKDRAAALGIVISDDMARQSEKFNDTMADVKRSMQGVYLQVAEALLPEMQKMAEWMSGPENRQAFATLITSLSNVVTFAVKGATAIAGITNAMLDFFRKTENKSDMTLQIRLAELEAAKDKLERDGGSKYLIDQTKGHIANVKAVIEARAAARRTSELQAQFKAEFDKNQAAADALKGIPKLTTESTNAARSAGRDLAAEYRKGFEAELADANKQKADALKLLLAYQEGGEEAMRLRAEQIDWADKLEAATKNLNAADAERISLIYAEIKALQDQLVVEQKATEQRKAEFEQFQDDIKQNKADTDDWMRDYYEHINEIGRVASDIAGNLFGALTQGADSFKDALKDTLAQLLAVIAQAAVLQAMGLGSGSFGSTLGSLLTGGTGAPRATGPNIRIMNFGGGIASTRTRSNGDIDVIIGQIAGRIAAGGSPLDKAFNTGFGLSRRGT